MDESEIITAIRNGADRYEDLVRRYHVGLIIHCEQLLGDRQDAEDIAQEAFVQAYLHLDTYDFRQARFSTWLYKIATNLAIDFLRKHNRKIVVEDIETVAEATMPTFLQDEQRQEIRAAVANLQPPEYQKVIIAYYWQGKPYAEIAQTLGVPINTVRTWIRRAKLQLKEKLS